jgi:predicted transcriptional regulator
MRIDGQEQPAECCGTQRTNVTRALGTLERVGAIRRVRAGCRTRIFVAPEGSTTAR